MSEKDTVAKSPKGRVSRTPIGVRNVLTVKGKDPDFEYRFVNDTGDRVEQFKEAGYEVVQSGSVRIGDKRVTAATPEGSAATASVGGGDKAVLMRIRKDWYKEDQAAKQSVVDQQESDMKQKAHDGTYGTFEISRDR